MVVAMSYWFAIEFSTICLSVFFMIVSMIMVEPDAATRIIDSESPVQFSQHDRSLRLS